MLQDKKVAGYFKGQWRGEVDKEMSSRDGGEHLQGRPDGICGFS